MEKKFDNNTMDNIKNLVEKGDISQAISQISPEMIENFSKLMNSDSSNFNNINKSNNSNINNTINNSNKPNTSNFYNSSYNSNTSYNNNNSYNSNTSYNNNNSYNSSHSNSFNFDNLDINTIMKMKSIMEKINNKNDPSYNLLNSLKPYLRESKKEKIDQYANLLNFSKIAEELNNNNKNNMS